MRHAVLAVTALLLACAEPEPEIGGDTAPATGEAQSSDSNATTPPVATAACRGDAQLARDRAGDLRIGMTAAEVRGACNVVADTTLMLEGQEQPALLVALGADTVIAELVDDAVWRMRVRSPGLMTQDSLHVGIAARELAGLSDAVIATGEGNTVVLAERVHCGLSFGLEGLPARDRRLTATDLATLPDSAHVGWILITGRCHGGA